MSDLVQWLVENEPEFRKSRLPSLYSDLGQLKSANPDGFAVNAAAWQAALKRAALAGQLPTEQKLIIRTSSQLLEALRSAQYGEPIGLGHVFNTAVQEGRLLELADFEAADHSIYQKSWVPSPSSVIRWTLRRAGLLSTGSYDSGGRLRDGQLVLIDGLEQITQQIVAIQAKAGQGVTDRIMSRDAFAQLVDKTGIGSLTEKETGILLRFLNRDKGLLSYNDSTVKFKAPLASQPEPITQEDTSIAAMKAYIDSVESSISTLAGKIQDLQATAQSAVQSKNRSAALSALRSKKRAEQALETRTATLNQVQDVYAKIEQAVDQVQIMQVMQSSAKTLRALNQRVGGVERVDEIMDDLRKQIGQTDEVGQILQESLGAQLEVHDAEIDDELEAMEKEEYARKETIDADAMKAKFAELDEVEAARQAEMERTKAKEGQKATIQEELSSSSQRLEKMHLDEDPPGKEQSRQRESAQLAAA